MEELKKLPRAVAVHDVSGYGKCALTVAIPVLSACGVEVCPIPTAVLSTNTNFPGFTLLDTSSELDRWAAQWEEIGMSFDALYSGFLGSAQQIDFIAGLLRRFSPAISVIDPVMADNGKLYKTYTPEMCEGMKRLVAVADLVTPNLTEACVLTGTEYDTAAVSTAHIRAMAEKLAEMGAKSVVITGIERGATLSNCVLDAEGYRELTVPLLPFRMHGTGDLFASVLTGGLLTGHSLDDSVDSAAAFVPYAMSKSREYEDYTRRGVCFEPYLSVLTGGLCRL